MDNEGKPFEVTETVTLPLRPPQAPSIHVRALLTWLVIFPLVAVGMTVSSPLVEDWHPALRALSLTLIVVPTTVYIGVPWLIRAYTRIIHIRYGRRVRRAAVHSQFTRS
jgi:antibiotic biosynthesis monooxygenase (ABM) superfamily enzyme